jgi:drug/metabolite transporter (DMT)-like permease
MSVPAAFTGVIIIWSTTPLMIQWSSEGTGYLFGVSSRMLLGAAVSSLLLVALARKISWKPQAVKTYVAAGLGIYGAMTTVYWGAQFIPSGLISVLFGLTPIFTGVLAAFWLNERSLTSNKLLGVALGITGLIVIFGNGIEFGNDAIKGILAVLLSVVLHSISAVWVKGIGAKLPAMDVTHGGLLIAAPLYLLTWFSYDGAIPEEISPRALMAILYLAVFGSVLGFFLYYYILKHIDASRVALATLITPVTALLLGQLLNNESHDPLVWIGTALILIGMSFYQWGSKLKSILNRE